jgi:hypothetical protein
LTFNRLHGVISQKTVLFIFIHIRIVTKRMEREDEG